MLLTDKLKEDTMEKHARKLSLIVSILTYVALSLFPRLRIKMKQSILDMALSGQIPVGLFPVFAELRFVDRSGVPQFVDTKPVRLWQRVSGFDSLWGLFNDGINRLVYPGLEDQLVYSQKTFAKKDEKITVEKKGMKFVVSLEITFIILDNALAEALTPLHQSPEDGQTVVGNQYSVAQHHTSKYDETAGPLLKPALRSYIEDKALAQAYNLGAPFSRDVSRISIVGDDILRITYEGVTAKKHERWPLIIRGLPLKNGFAWEILEDEDSVTFEIDQMRKKTVTFFFGGMRGVSDCGLPPLPKGYTWSPTKLGESMFLLAPIPSQDVINLIKAQCSSMEIELAIKDITEQSVFGYIKR